MNKLLKAGAAMLLAALCAAFMLSCTPKKVSRTEVALDTVISITLYGKTTTDELDGVFGLISAYEGQFDMFDEGSLVSAINGANGGYVEINEELEDMLEIARHYYDISGGLFDVTIGELTSLWHDARELGVLPDAGSIDALTKRPQDGFSMVVDSKKAAMKDGAALDLGGIAKGYIGDLAKEYLISRGVKSAFINLGGDVAFIGKNGLRPFSLGVQKPFSKNGELVATIDVADKCVATSGIYERFFESGGKMYHHLINPFEGYPAENDVISATVLHDNLVSADCLASICVLLGGEKAIELIEGIDGAECLIILESGEIMATNGLKWKKVD